MGIQFKTDQSGANNNVCSTSSLTFNFSLARNDTLDSASFSIKKSSGTIDNIIVTIYNAPNGGGSVVESVSIAASNITQSFTDIVFTFSGNTTLMSGTSYSLKITSPTGCSGNNPYSVKTGNFQVTETGGGVINTGYGISANINSNSSFSQTGSLSTHINLSISNNTTISTNALRSIPITSTMNSLCSMSTQAILTRSTSTYIKIGNSTPFKIYLNDKTCKIYRGSQLIINAS